MFVVRPSSFENPLSLLLRQLQAQGRSPFRKRDLVEKNQVGFGRYFPTQVQRSFCNVLKCSIRWVGSERAFFSCGLVMVWIPVSVSLVIFALQGRVLGFVTVDSENWSPNGKHAWFPTSISANSPFLWSPFGLYHGSRFLVAREVPVPPTLIRLRKSTCCEPRGVNSNMEVRIIPHQKVTVRIRLSCFLREMGSQKKGKFDFLAL